MQKRSSKGSWALLREIDRRNVLRAKAFYDDNALDTGDKPVPHSIHWKIARYEQLVAVFLRRKAAAEIIDRYETELYQLYKKEYSRYKLALSLGKWSLD